MSKTMPSQSSLIADLWASFSALPTWVKIWMMFLLMPANMASLFFLDQPMGTWIAILALGGMLPNLPVLAYERGFSKLLAIPHLISWTLLVGLILLARPEVSGIYKGYVWGVLVIDTISLFFDYSDAFKWITGQRKVAGR